MYVTQLFHRQYSLIFTKITKNLSPTGFFKLETSNFQEMSLKWIGNFCMLEFFLIKNFMTKTQKKILFLSN